MTTHLKPFEKWTILDLVNAIQQRDYDRLDIWAKAMTSDPRKAIECMAANSGPDVSADDVARALGFRSLEDVDRCLSEADGRRR